MIMSLRDVPKTLIWANLGSSGPLEAPRGQTSHTIQNFNKCHFSKKIEILNFQQFKFQKKIGLFVCRCKCAAGAKRRTRQAPQVPSAAGPSAAGAKRRRLQVPQAPSAAGVLQHGSQQEARGPSAARVMSAHPQGCIYVFDHPEGESDR